MEDDQTPPRDLTLTAPGGDSGRERSAGALFFEALRGLVGGRAAEAARSPEAGHDLPPINPHEDRQLVFRNVLRFEELTAADVMTPRADILAVPETAGLQEVAETFLTHGLTRLPVYRGRLDDVTGFLHAKDVLRVLYRGCVFHMSELKREILFVPPSMRVSALLLKMRISRVHMAVVVDEYGATDGLVTFHDLIREIVGDTPDEHDENSDSAEWAPCEGGGYHVSARLPVEDLEAKIGVKLVERDEEDEFDTVGGLLISLLGRVPHAGEIVEHVSGVQFTVLEADPRRVKKVKVARF